jgi:hypothetical protein
VEVPYNTREVEIPLVSQVMVTPDEVILVPGTDTLEISKGTTAVTSVAAPYTVTGTNSAVKTAALDIRIRSSFFKLVPLSFIYYE